MSQKFKVGDHIRMDVELDEIDGEEYECFKLHNGKIGVVISYEYDASYKVDFEGDVLLVFASEMTLAMKHNRNGANEVVSKGANK